MARVRITKINTDELSGKARVLDVGVGEPNIRGRTIEFIAPEICEIGGGVDSVFDCKFVYTHTIRMWGITGYTTYNLGFRKITLPNFAYMNTKMYVAIKFDIVVWD